MTPNEYWQKEINKARELVAGGDPPEIIAALIIAGQLQAISRTLSEIRAQLQGIEDSINN